MRAAVGRVSTESLAKTIRRWTSGAIVATATAMHVARREGKKGRAEGAPPRRQWRATPCSHKWRPPKMGEALAVEV